MKTQDDKKRDDLGMPPVFQKIKIEKKEESKEKLIKDIIELAKRQKEFENNPTINEEDVPKIMVLMDDAEILRATKSFQMISALYSMDLWLRDEIKYKERKDSETLQEVRDKLTEIMQDKNLYFDELYF